jgi:hypothetical protein
MKKTLKPFAIAALIVSFSLTPSIALASINPSSQPALSLSGSTVTSTLAIWPTNQSESYFLRACTNPATKQETGTLQFGPSNCQTVSVFGQQIASDLSVASVAGGSYDPAVHGSNIVLMAGAMINNTTYYVWTDSVVYTGGSSGSSSNETPTPAKYSGPEFSGLSGMGIMTGSTGKLEGKRLDQISSIEIGGNAATFTATSAAELELSLPAGLAPGLYDLVINSSAGKLTHINAIQVREPKQSFSITTRSTGKISEEQYLEHSLIAAMQAPELNKARCIVNASTQAMAEAMAKRLCAIVKASNPNIETTVVVPRSTVRNDTVFARVIYGWN